MKKAFILNIGEELLIGQVANTNVKWMSEQLSSAGIEIIEQRVTSDNESQIIDALKDGHEIANIILVTGGLGPTNDDVTKNALSQFFNTPLEFHPSSYSWIQKLFKRLNREVKPAHREQCYLPKSAEVFENKYGTAPAMMFEKDDVITFSLPGVPYEMEYLMNEYVLPEINKEINDRILRSKTILTVGAGESVISERLEAIESKLPGHINLAYLPHLAQVKIRVSSFGASNQEVDNQIKEWSDRIKDRLGNLVYGEDDDNLPLIIQKYCIERNITVGTAESCTSGLLANQLTFNSGSSAFYEGGIVAYSNQLKRKLLSVPEQTLEAYGAVSRETVIAMVKGAIDSLNVDVAVATSGISGPTGGTQSKPVGTIWLACGNKDRIDTQLLHLGKYRSLNNEYSTIMALNLLRHFLMGV